MDLRERPKPRVRFEEVPDEIAPLLRGLTGGFEDWGVYDHADDPGDYDLLVTFAQAPDSLHPRDFVSSLRDVQHLHVLAFGARSATYVGVGVHERRQRTVERNNSTTAASVRIADNVITRLPGWRRLLTDSVEPAIPATGKKDYWGEVVPLSGAVAETLFEVGEGSRKGAAAMLISRAERESGKVLLLPESTTHHREWLVLFLEYLREIDPDNFPAAPDWKRRGDWAPPGLADAIAAHEALEHERETVLAEIDARLLAKVGEIEQQIVAAADGHQRLLTETGTPLEQAVEVALGVLGFGVRDMDAEKEEGDPRLEDFRLTDVDEPGWVALVEVKGYGGNKGASANDVAQITGRPSTAYAIETGRAASALFHIVNGQAGMDPATRQEALKGDTALDILAESEGALVDTRDLFRAVYDIEARLADAATVRSTLRSARKRWTYTPVEPTSP